MRSIHIEGHFHKAVSVTGKDWVNMNVSVYPVCVCGVGMGVSECIMYTLRFVSLPFPVAYVHIHISKPVQKLPWTWEL